MAKKRKLVAKQGEAPVKQQRRLQQAQAQAQAGTGVEEAPNRVVEEVKDVQEGDEGETKQNMDQEEEYEEVEGDEKGAEEEVAEGEEGEEDGGGGAAATADADASGGGGGGGEGDQMVDADNEISTSLKEAASAATDHDDDGADDPIRTLLEPFTKEQLVGLLSDVAEKYADVADRVRKVADGDPAHRKIFVHGLGWDTNAESLISVFKQYGEIEDCKAVCDKISGKSKGYGFILFKNRKGARSALQQPQKKIGSRITACQLASMGPVPNSPPAAAPTPVAPALPASEYTLKKIYVSNVPAELDPQKLLNFFSRYGEIEEGPLGLDKQTGKPKGFCLFVYKTMESAKKALEEPHKNFEGRILYCQKAIDGPKPGKKVHHHNSQNTHFQRNKNSNFSASVAAGPAYLMAPPAGGISMNQAAPSPLNPAAVGQALTALIAAQGAGFGLTDLFGNLGSAGMNQGVPVAVHGMQGGYGNQGVPSNIMPGVMGGYGTPGGPPPPNQQTGYGGSGSSHAAGGAPYMGH